MCMDDKIHVIPLNLKYLMFLKYTHNILNAAYARRNKG